MLTGFLAECTYIFLKWVFLVCINKNNIWSGFIFDSRDCDSTLEKKKNPNTVKPALWGHHRTLTSVLLKKG